jgi:hypothetical protein
MPDGNGSDVSPNLDLLNQRPDRPKRANTRICLARQRPQKDGSKARSESRARGIVETLLVDRHLGWRHTDSRAH